MQNPKSILLMGLYMVPFVALAQQNQKPLISPEIKADNSVTFRLHAPEAQSVKIASTLYSDYSQVDMIKGDSGVWSATVESLAPDMYVYTYLVDGVTTLDPNNKIVVRDGGHIESRLMIPGKQTDLYDVKEVPHGWVSSVWYPAKTLGLTRRCMVYTPPGYHTSSETYPVLYLLHGGGGDEEAWLNRGRMNYILDNLIAQGKAEPMVVIIPNGVPNATSAPSETPLDLFLEQGTLPNYRAMIGNVIAKSMMENLIPFVEANFRVKTDPANRAITGLSMGGYQTQKITNLYPGKFDYIGEMSMGLYDQFEPDYDKDQHIKQLMALKESNPKLYWIACGKEDFLYEGLKNLLSFYDAQDFDYTYRESEGGHSWNNWRLYLSEFAPMIFR